jgi:alpha-tubulin suppressor-like RCC1 family protein
MGTSTGADPRTLRLAVPLRALLPLCWILAACEEAPATPGGDDVRSVLLNPATLAMAVGEVIRLDVLPVNRENRRILGGPATWSSSAPTVAAVDSLGLVRAIGEGAAQITASVNGVAGSAAVTVTPVAVSEWREHACFVGVDGNAWCWGRGGNGELGDGSRTSSPVPVRVRHDAPFAAVTAGASHSCGITGAGEAWCWGRGTEGQLGSGAATTRVTPVRVSDAASWRALSAGGRHSCGITATGDTRCWGDAAFGQLGHGSTTSVITPVPPQGGLRLQQVSAGARHTCGLAADGRAWCWGDNRNGQLGDGSSASRSSPGPVLTEQRFTDISAGARHTCAVALDGRPWCWGDNRSGQLGNGTLTSSFAPSAVASVPGFRLARVAAGGSHSCGIAPTGVVFCWGAGQFGQLGDGRQLLAGNPVEVQVALFDQLIAGNAHTCGVSRAATALCWGLNVFGQLGTGDFRDRAHPEPGFGGYRFGRGGG